MATPVTSSGLSKYDHLPPADAARRAWNEPGANPDWHRRMREQVRQDMPLLARALDRLPPEVRGNK